MRTVNLSLTWRGRSRLGTVHSDVVVEIEDIPYEILAGIARGDNDTIQGVVERIIEDGLLPIFSDVIRVRVPEGKL